MIDEDVVQTMGYVGEVESFYFSQHKLVYRRIEKVLLVVQYTILLEVVRQITYTRTYTNSITWKELVYEGVLFLVWELRHNCSNIPSASFTSWKFDIEHCLLLLAISRGSVDQVWSVAVGDVVSN